MRDLAAFEEGANRAMSKGQALFATPRIDKERHSPPAPLRTAIAFFDECMLGADLIGHCND